MVTPLPPHPSKDFWHPKVRPPVGFPAASTLLAGTLLAYAFVMAGHAVRAHRRRLEDRSSVTLGAVELAALAGLVAVEGPRVLDGAMTAAVLAFGLVGVVWAGVHRLVRGRARRADEVAPITRESRRKGFHLVLALVIAGYWWLGPPGLWLVHGTAHALAPSVFATAAAPAMPIHDAGHVLSVAALIAVALLSLPLETYRISRPNGPFVLQRFTEVRLREPERVLYGHHLYILVATALALLFLGRGGPPWESALPAMLATVAVTVFSDAAAAMAGTRWGKRKIPFNPKKSYVGCVAGFVVAVLAAWPFVGLGGGILAGILMVAIDLATPRLIHISDNLVNPIALAVGFKLAGFV